MKDGLTKKNTYLLSKRLIQIKRLTQIDDHPTTRPTTVSKSTESFFSLISSEILVPTSGDVMVGLEGELVQLADEAAELHLVVLALQLRAQLAYLSLVHLASPLKPILAVGDHLSQLLVLVHPSHKALRETARLMLPGVGGKADYVEVALDEVDDHVFPHILLVLCRGVVLVFHLNDGFSQVLHAH